MEGVFLLSELTNVSYTSDFGTIGFSGPDFDPLDLSLIGISVSQIDMTSFSLVFIGDSASTAGSLDVVTNAGIVSHEPGDLFSIAPSPKLYFMEDSVNGADFFGDYIGISNNGASVSSPATLLMFTAAAFGLARLKRN